MTQATFPDPAQPSVLWGDGACGRLIAGLDWPGSLGPPEGWPPPLRTLLGVMMGSNQPMFVAWGPERTLIYNDPYAEILADKHPGAMGCPFLEVWREIRDDLIPIVEKAYRGEAVQMDDILLMMERRGFPEEAHFAFSYTPVRDGEGAIAGFFCACRETTGQVLTERRLRDSEARLRGVLDGMGEAFGLIDHDFRILSLNRAAMELEPRPFEEIVGRCHWEAYPGSEESEIGRLYKRAMAERVPVGLEHRYVWPDGAARWLDMRAYPVPEGLAVFWRDVTERKEAEARLRDSEARAREEAFRVQLALDAGAILGTWTWDLRADRFTADERFAETFGLDSEACRAGMPVGEVVETVHPDDEPALMAAMDEALARGGPYVHQYRVRGRDGLYRWIEAHGRVDLGPDGKPLRFPGVLLDIEGRRAAEAERDRAMGLLEAFFEAVPGVVYAKDREGRMLVANHGTTELIGKPPEAYLGRTDAEFLEDKAQARAVMANDRRIMEGGRPEQVEEEVRRPDGTPAVWLSTKAPLRDAEGAVVGLIGSSVDITARKATEAALAESEARFRNMADHSPVMMWVTRSDGACTYLNREWYEFTGQTPEEAEGFGWLEATHPDDKAEAERVFVEANARHAPFRIEYRLRRADGTYRWAIDAAAPRTGVDGGFLGYIGSVIDIHERREAEERLRESEERYRTLFETIESGFCLAEVRQGGPGGRTDYRVIEANPAFYKQTGFPEAILGQWLREAAPALEDHWFEVYGRVARTGEPSRFEQGSEHLGRWFDVYAFRVGEPEEGRVGILFNDISARRNAEEALRELNETLEMRVAAAIAEREQVEEALRQSQKMEAVGQLTGGIAHDFNNMLAAVMGSLDLLGRRIGAEDARARRYVDAAQEGARRAAMLTQRLLAFSRQQPLRPEHVDLNRLVQGMSDLLGRSLGAGVRLETVLAGGLWPAHADPHQLENVILNLALNARDAMPEGGRLTIETANAHLDSHYSAEHLGLPPGQYVQVAVSDTGHGMSPEVIARAFDPFFTTKPVGQGTGLGLSQAYGFVKQSGGHVKIYSEPGRGTAVKIYLPRVLVEPREERAEERSLDLLRGEAEEVVLVVEDEAVVRQFTVDALADLGYRVLEADGARAALHLLDAHPEVTVLFTDVVMPETDGRRLANEALRRRPGLRVLFTTGYTRSAVVHNGVLDPGVNLLGKPFTVEELAAKMREVLDGSPTPA